MRFRTRAFLTYFVPFALLLSVSFWIIQRQVQATVRAELRSSLSASQAATSRIHAKNTLDSNRFLRVAGENAALKAGIQLLVMEGNSEAARRTVEDQLLELGEHMGFDFLAVSSPNGTPLAGVLRGATGDLAPLDVSHLPGMENGLAMLGEQVYQIGSTPMDADGENVGSLAVGERFEVGDFANSGVLIHDGRVIQSSVPGVSANELEAGLRQCGGESECDLRLGGDEWLSLPVHGVSGDVAYVIRSLTDVDAAIAPARRVLRRLFAVAAFGVVIVALLCSYVSAQSIVKPIAAMVEHLRRSELEGLLAEFESSISTVAEVRELAETYNRAAGAAREAGRSLENAYVEFVGSLANALDARDRYTAGHSQRVSELSCALARALQLSDAEIEKVRIGALLHDIGKIGISDAVLQKPGRLTEEEFELIRQHPVIGRRILEGVQGLSAYLPAVELHHENWDGTGYPKRQSGEETPIEARIIHVADAYDAMTTNRSYRRGMAHEKAMDILLEYAGTQFDPKLVELFRKLPEAVVCPTAGMAQVEAVEAA